jgi:hypothetical protein
MMKRVILGLLLVLVLAFGVCGAATAAPLDTNQGFVVFGEYAPAMLYAPFNVFVIGAGYGFTENFAVGLEVENYGASWMLGGFLNLSLGPVLLTGEFIGAPAISGGTRAMPTGLLGKATGLYVFDLDTAKLAIGAGTLFVLGGGGSPPPEIPLFIEAKANMSLAEKFSLYGAIDYYVSLYDGLVNFSVGASYSF